MDVAVMVDDVMNDQVSPSLFPLSKKWDQLADFAYENVIFRVQIEVEVLERWTHQVQQETSKIQRSNSKKDQTVLFVGCHAVCDSFLQSRAHTGSLPAYCLEIDDEELDEIEAELNDSEADSVYDTSTEAPETPCHLETKPAVSFKGRGKRVITTADDSYKRTVCGCTPEKSVKTSENPDLEFFKSILPDMAEFSASQKRRFKMRVLQLLEEISSEGKVFSSPSALLTHFNSSTENNSYQRPPGSQLVCRQRVDSQDPNA